MNKKATEQGRRKKSMQYVIEHLALGKMLYPLENADPLFTEHAYEDESMKLQLRPGAYTDFQAQVQEKLRWIKSGALEVEGSLEDALEGVNIGTKGTKRLDRLREYLVDVGVSWDDVDKEMIGLVLRYRCMAGFDNLFHGSVPAKWGNVIPEYHECFASPLNHKFSNYYSMFNEDAVFGSKGNFFAMVVGNGGVLPSGKYEINPPWTNASFELVKNILRLSIDSGSIIQAIIVGPNWTDAPWIDGLNSLARRYGRSNLVYMHDMNGGQFRLETLFWLISPNEDDERLLQALGLV